MQVCGANHFTEAGSPRAAVKVERPAAVFLSAEAIQQARAACGLSRQEQQAVESNPVEYEEPAHTVNISIDDVGVKKQKEERGAGSQNGPQAGKRQYAPHTIAHIQAQEKSYTINGGSVASTLRLVIGFLLPNALLRYRLQFFVDGQKTLYAAIVKTFSWVSNLGIILDWYHLEEKCKIQLSLALKGRHLRNATLEELMPLLWYGMVDQALHYLSALKSEVIKNRAAVEVLIKYLERNRPYLPCYGVRKQLGLRNSSNIGEKMNDLIVSERQKHNGMSWSKGGAVALASVTALKRNQESHHWFEDRDVEFKFVA